MFSRFLPHVRDAAWLDASRVRVWTIILLTLLCVGATGLVWLSEDLIDAYGKPLASDFVSFYAAARLAISGHPADAWNVQTHAAAQNAIFGRDLGYWAFFYPPPYLLLIAPFGWLSYGPAVLIWSSTTLSAAIVVMRRWTQALHSAGRIGFLFLLAFPALWINLGHGQNAALTLAILAGGFLCLDRRPWLAGLILGLLVIKPQMALALPFMLAFGGRWKTFLATALSAGALCLVSFALLGGDSWRGFIETSGLARLALEQNMIGAARLQSVFAAAQRLSIPVGGAYLLQALTAIGALTWAGLTLRRQYANGQNIDGLTLGAMTGAVTALLSPFFLDYDLLVIAIPVVWLASQGLTRGFLPWERIGLLAAYLIPFLARLVALSLPLPLAPVTVVVLMWLISRRMAWNRTVSAAGSPQTSSVAVPTG